MYTKAHILCVRLSLFSICGCELTSASSMLGKNLSPKEGRKYARRVVSDSKSSDNYKFTYSQRWEQNFLER